MANELVQIPNMIYEIRGQKVMLDSDLACLYEVEAKRLNEAVKNIKPRPLLRLKPSRKIRHTAIIFGAPALSHIR